MKNTFLFILLYTALGSTILAQNIKGTIKSPSDEGIQNATISVLNTGYHTITDAAGNFNLNLKEGSYSLEITASGYSAKIEKIWIQNEALNLNIVLIPNFQELEEIIVSANKMDEQINKVPVAISTISSKKVQDARIWEAGNLSALVPNFLYQELGVGFQQIQAIRGIQVFSENPAVATYIDDVNGLDILANGFQFTDIDRIEILRGPQGTLFGRNAMAGVVNIITKKPTNQKSGFAEMSIGNLGLQRYSAGFKSPLIKDKLFFGLNGLFQNRNGYLRNDTTGTRSVLKNIQNVRIGDESNLYGNAYLKWLPNNVFSATLNFKSQADHSDASGFFVSVSDEIKGFAHPTKIYLSRIGSHERNILNSSLVLKYFGSNFTITSTSSLQAISLAYKDIDFPGYYHSFSKNKIGENLPPQKVYGQEVRIQSDIESRFRYSAGINYFSQTGYEPSTNLAYEAAPDYYAVYRNKAENNGIAFFGQMGYSISKNWNATAGLRYDIENRKAIFNGFGDAIFTGGTLTFIRPDTSISGKYNAFSPKVALNYSIDKFSSAYISFTKGFRAGGINSQRVPAGVSQTFDPEYSNNYEIGFKSNAMNNKARINLAAFLINWQNLQFYNLVAPFTYARENLGDVITKGVELEGTFLPFKNWELDGSIGINNGHYKDFKIKRTNFTTFQDEIIDVSEKHLTNAPNHTLYLASQYTWQVNKESLITFRLEWRSIGKYFTDLQNTLKQPSYSLINSKIDFKYKKIVLSLWGQNLGNTKFLIYGSGDTSFGRSVRMGSPLTWGITSGIKF